MAATDVADVSHSSGSISAMHVPPVAEELSNMEDTKSPGFM